MNALAEPKDESRRRFGQLLDRVRLTVLAVLVMFLAFVAGGVSTVLKAPVIDDFMQSVSMGLFYLYESNVNADTFDYFWYPAHLPGPKGKNPVVLNDTVLAGKGYNLIIGTHEQAATLIDMNGKTVHKWARRFDEIWDKAPQLSDYDRQEADYWAEQVYWRRAHLYTNGDILVIYETPYRTPYGLGLAKLDKNSNIIWKIDSNVHHDTAIGRRGEIYTLGQEINETGYEDYPALRPPFIDDSVLIVSADGKVEKEFSIIKAFLNSQYSAFLSFMSSNLRGDVVHANTVQYIDGATAEKFAFADEGHLLISAREMNVIAVLDPMAERIVWAQTGPWKAQHEPVMLDNGRIILFDNQGNAGDGGATRIIEFDPISGAIHWSHAGTVEEPLDSPYWGSVQRLASGNTMIVESTNGRAVEVTPEGKIVWDYRSPNRKTEDGEELVAPLMDVVRVEPGALTFLDR